MKLNPDCIRDLLLEVEENVGIGKGYRYNFESLTSNNRLAKYTKDESLYHANQCEMSGLVVNVRITNDFNCYIADLSPNGHAFLADIRADTLWNKVKDKAKDLGIGSINALVEIAKNLVTSMITRSFL